MLGAYHPGKPSHKIFSEVVPSGDQPAAVEQLPDGYAAAGDTYAVPDEYQATQIVDGQREAVPAGCPELDQEATNTAPATEVPDDPDEARGGFTVTLPHYSYQSGFNTDSPTRNCHGTIPTR
jgi:hypothetical protein